MEWGRQKRTLILAGRPFLDSGRLLLMTGYSANAMAHQGEMDEVAAFIRKPFSVANLVAKLQEVLK